MTNMLNRSAVLLRYCLFGLLIVIAGCASLDVTQVTNDNKGTVKGVHYYLPKPFLQVTPQADGSIEVDVIYLPDKAHEYAIDTSSHLSDFTFQVSRDEKGLLNSVEYKASTSVVAQQLATSAGAAAAQQYNLSAVQQAAVQSQVNTAAANVDTANGNLQAALAALASDQEMGVQSLAADRNAVAQAAAKLSAAQEALQRVRSTSQAVSTTVSAGPVASTTEPSMGNTFGQPTWNTSTVASLPGRYAPVLLAINDTGDAVQLKTITEDVPGSVSVTQEQLEGGVTLNAQPAFETVSLALGPPAISPKAQTVSLSKKVAQLVVSRPIDSVQATITDAHGKAAKADVTKVGTTLSIDITPFAPGDYTIGLSITYSAGSTAAMPSVTTTAQLTIIN